MSYGAMMITVEDSPSFDAWANGIAASAPEMHKKTVEMPNLSSLLEGFNQQADVKPGSFMANVNAGLEGYAESLKEKTPNFANYWGVTAAQPAPTEGFVSGISSLADSLTGSAPVEPGVNTSRLSQSFGGLSAPQQPEIGEHKPSINAFERRYKGPENS